MAQNHATFRFYAELNDFLSIGKKSETLTDGSRAESGDGSREMDYVFNGHPSVKDAIEAQGVPHVEVDLVLVNGQSVDFSYGLSGGDRVAVYPVFESLDVTPVTHLRPAPLRDTKFMLDVHLGKLCGYLRLFGFDSEIMVPERSRGMEKDDQDALIEKSLSENRNILTRNAQLLKNGRVTHGIWIRSENSREQLVQVIRRFDLSGHVKPFVRCKICNGLLQTVRKEDIQENLPPSVRETYNDFTKCGSCGQVYWKGSHYDRMKEFMDDVVSDVRGAK